MEKCWRRHYNWRRVATNCGSFKIKEIRRGQDNNNMIPTVITSIARITTSISIIKKATIKILS